MTKDKKDEAQQKMMQFQMLEQSFQEIKQRQQAVVQKMEEISVTRASIEELKKEKEGDALIPVGSNNFISGGIKDSKNIFVGIGGGVVVKKTREEAMEIIDRQIEDIRNAMDELVGQERKTMMELQRLEPEIQELIKSVKLG